jgi:hypothetical protein
MILMKRSSCSLFAMHCHLLTRLVAPCSSVLEIVKPVTICGTRTSLIFHESMIPKLAPPPPLIAQKKNPLPLLLCQQYFHNIYQVSIQDIIHRKALLPQQGTKTATPKVSTYSYSRAYPCWESMDSTFLANTIVKFTKCCTRLNPGCFIFKIYLN